MSNHLKHRIKDYIDNLSLKEMRAYAKTADRLLWIEYNVLDMIGDGISNSYAEFAEQWLDATINEAFKDLNK